MGTISPLWPPCTRTRPLNYFLKVAITACVNVLIVIPWDAFPKSRMIFAFLIKETDIQIDVWPKEKEREMNQSTSWTTRQFGVPNECIILFNEPNLYLEFSG